MGRRTRRLYSTNATKLLHGSMRTRQLKRMSLKTRRRKWRVCAHLSSRSCMLQLVVRLEACLEACLEVCLEVCLVVCQTWVQVPVQEVGQLSKRLINLLIG